MINANRPLRRKSIPLKNQLHAALYQLGLEPQEAELDHCPALVLRDYDEKAGDTEPKANDPKYLIWRTREDHKKKTFGTKATSAGGDIHRAAQMRRLTKKQEEFRARLMAKGVPDDGIKAEVKQKPKQKIANRGFEKRSKPKRGKP
jgi:hypothetical protein